MVEETAVTILCCLCGTSIRANSANTCASCLQTNHDVTKDFAKNGVLLKCKGCERYQKASQEGWIECDIESKPLLALCLKKIKGLDSVSLIDAKFVWTEEHSKRIKVKLRVQKEVTKDAILQQDCVVEFVVQNKFCDDCHAKEASFAWDSVVQLRQKVSHKRTFLYLEQLIIKHGEDENTIKIEPKPDGVDFFFAAKNDAVRFLDFLQTVIPVKYKVAKQVVSIDVKSNVCKYNTTFSTEIVPICKDDIVCFPKGIANKLGDMSRVALCTTISNVLRFIDPVTCQLCELTPEVFYRQPFRSIKTAQQLISFVVLDVQIQKSPEIKIKTSNSSTNKTHSKKRRRKGGKQMATILTSAGVNISPNHGVALIEVARESDFGVNDKRYTVFSHLAYVLKAGDTCLGYDMAHMVINDDDAKGLDRDSVSEIILVKKSYPKWRKKVKTRNWQLKSLVNNADGGAGFGIVGKPREKGEDARMQQDKEMFLRDLEEDEDMRNKINLYKLDKNDINPSKDKNYTTDEENEEIEDDIPVINVENLLDNMNLSGENEKTNSADDDL